MKIIGWCTECRKVKTVRVSAAGMAMLAKGTPMGICDACQHKQDDRRRSRRGD